VREIDHMPVCVKDDIVPHTPGEEGLRISDAICESARAGRTVKLAQPREPEPREEEV